MRPTLMLAAVLAVFTLNAGPGAADSPCGREGEPCSVASGTYRLALPDGPAPEGGYPALMFFHGAGQSGKITLSNTGMVDTFLKNGWAVIAPDGEVREGRFGRGWSFRPGSPALRDEATFTREVLADAEQYGIDRDRIMLGGFSIGGSLVWYLACQHPDIATAYAPVAGAFWRPHPDEGSCAGPVRMLHTHGWRDETVPLEGRPLRSGTIMQGDVFYSLMLMREANGCTQMRADDYDTSGPFWRRWWTRCTPGSALEFALHTGGHMVPPGWAEMAIDWFGRVEPSPDKQG